MYNAFLILIDMLNQTEAYWHMAASGAQGDTTANNANEVEIERMYFESQKRK